tara:strand:+ start:490 stop:645 length:156 start_codon:yes stop_codon:yes gene_type:complete
MTFIEELVEEKKELKRQLHERCKLIKRLKRMNKATVAHITENNKYLKQLRK